jgi:hypothetical protein
MALNNIQKLLQNKVETLQIELQNAELELKRWQAISEDYLINPERYDMMATLLSPEQSDLKKSKKKSGIAG